MKKLVLLFLLLVVIVAGIAGWMFLGPATSFEAKKQALYIRTNAATKEAVLDSLAATKIVTSNTAFNWLADQMDLWKSIRPGKYEIQKGSSLLTIIRTLRNGRQTPVNLVITKLRTKEDFARLVGRRFECDSAQVMGFLKSSDSLKAFGVDTSQAMTAVLPDTYTFFWNTTPQKIYTKLHEEMKKFWNAERTAKAEALGLTPTTAYTLASIVEEETNNRDEQDTMASVYLNRIAKGMPLQADPTIKFGLRDFGLKRIYEKHWRVPTPYNTYLNRGLPPGPICTPSKPTIEAVLNAPQTSYFYFVADKAFDGTHVFTTNYTDHLKYAHGYQRALDSLINSRKPKT